MGLCNKKGNQLHNCFKMTSITWHVMYGVCSAPFYCVEIFRFPIFFSDCELYSCTGTHRSEQVPYCFIA
jgi:hypothetical protein